MNTMKKKKQMNEVDIDEDEARGPISASYKNQ